STLQTVEVADGFDALHRHERVTRVGVEQLTLTLADEVPRLVLIVAEEPILNKLLKKLTSLPTGLRSQAPSEVLKGHSALILVRHSSVEEGSLRPRNLQLRACFLSGIHGSLSQLKERVNVSASNTLSKSGCRIDVRARLPDRRQHLMRNPALELLRLRLPAAKDERVQAGLVDHDHTLSDRPRVNTIVSTAAELHKRSSWDVMPRGAIKDVLDTVRPDTEDDAYGPREEPRASVPLDHTNLSLKLSVRVLHNFSHSELPSISSGFIT